MLAVVAVVMPMALVVVVAVVVVPVVVVAPVVAVELQPQRAVRLQWQEPHSLRCRRWSRFPVCILLRF